jgi:hypothetical protein
VRDDLKVMNVTNWTELPLKGRAWNTWLIKPEPERGLKLMEEKEEESPTTDSNSM